MAVLAARLFSQRTMRRNDSLLFIAVEEVLPIIQRLGTITFCQFTYVRLIHTSIFVFDRLNVNLGAIYECVFQI